MTLQQDEEGQEESYVRIKVLGKGAFGEAVLYRKPDNNLLVVWKEIDLNRVSSRSYVEVQNEIDILSLLNHANIVAYYNHYFHENMLYIEMEYANGGSLYHKIVSQTKLFQEDEIRWFLYQILSAVEYIHDKNILHRDIKTLNIFLNKAGLLKLGDFGMSKLMEQNVMADTVVGTPYYMSPELIKGQKYDAKSDIWAVGCVLHEMLTLTKTFMASNTLKLANDILKGEISPIDASYTPEMTKIVSKCFNVDPLERPTAMELLSLEIFKENEKMFLVKTEELKSVLNDNRPPSRGQVFSTKDPSELSSTVPVVTQSSTEVFFWGGGKTQPQMIDVFVEGKSALSTSIGDNHVAIVTIENELYTWLVAKGGDFQISGQLGHGDNALYKAPKLVNAFEGIRIKSVSCGCDFSCCITDSGVLYTFGSNYFGCLGVGNKVDHSLSPCKVPLFENSSLTKVSCGDYHVVAVSTSGDVFSWGCGEFGRLGTGNEDDQFEPVKITIPGSVLLREISCGFDFTLFLTVTEKLLACGSNEFNKLGMNQCLKGVAPEELSFDTPCVYSPSLVKPLAKSRLTFAAAGKTHSAVINDSGHLLTFGSNEFGQLGQGDSKPRTKVVQVKNALAGKRVTKVSCGDGFTIAVTSDNQVYSWGLGENGRLGMDLSLQTKGLAFTALPRSIFGTLYKVKNVCSRGWNTVLIAEKVFSQKTLRPSSASSSRPTTAASTEKTNPNPTAKRIEFKEILSDDIHIVSFDGSDSDTNPAEIEHGSTSSVPTWLAQELEANELIPFLKVQKDEATIRTVEKNNSNDNEFNISADFNKRDTNKNLSLDSVSETQIENFLKVTLKNSTDNVVLENMLNSKSENNNTFEIELLHNENVKLRRLLDEKDERINELENQLIRCICKCRIRSDSEEIFDV